MKAFLPYALTISFLLSMTSCSSILYPRKGDYPNGRGVGKNTRMLPYSSLRVPPGHLPPPGECKVWFPGLPPGQQPPPESCESAFVNRPIGAWVITNERRRFKVVEFKKIRGEIVDEISYYLTQ